MSCKPHTKLASDCDCILKLQQGSNIIVLNLSDAIVRPLNDITGTEIGFNIQTAIAGVNVLAAGSNITRAEVETLICSCNSSAGGGAEPTVTLCQFRQVLSGVGTWNRPAATRSVSYFVQSVGDTLDPPTVTDNTGSTDLFLNESATWSVNADKNSLTGTFTITTKADDVVVVVYTTNCS